MLSDAYRQHLLHGLVLALGVVWVYAGVAKLRAPRATAASVQRMTGAGATLAAPLGWLLPAAEIVLGATLIAHWYPLVGTLVSIGLFTLFAVLIVVAAARDALGEGGCGCFGASRRPGRADVVDAPRAIARNLLLVVLALAALSILQHQHQHQHAAPAPAASHAAEIASPS